ncbi:layilin isoform X4 [Zonotrichia albicollis]|uniref:layilin isoform X4 n=1 Tax=Zonotrichia albicollis TaxID=44394 RepID=UPI003D80C35E
MLAAAALCAAALGCAAGARLLSAAVDISLRRGQTVCRRGTQKPCYKIVYFHDASRRTSYEEAHLACRADGGHLVSIESPAEQRLIESLIRSLLASDGDFWIGLRRRKEEGDNSTECHRFYSWSDGSSSKFRNWYVDEPSCGGEVCVVLYHQPSAPPGLGGPYMFQWNDDRCTMKNNFICKYALEKPTRAPIDNSRRAVATEPWKPKFPEERWRKGANGTAGRAKEPIQGLAFILISSVPVLLLLLAITGISCFWLFMKRRQELLDVSLSRSWDFPGEQAGIRNILGPALLKTYHQITVRAVLCLFLCAISCFFPFALLRRQELLDAALSRSWDFSGEQPGIESRIS